MFLYGVALGFVLGFTTLSILDFANKVQDNYLWKLTLVLIAVGINGILFLGGTPSEKIVGFGISYIIVYSFIWSKKVHFVSTDNNSNIIEFD